MANVSRNSFDDTRNALAELRGLAPPGPAPAPHYVSIRLQQAVPLVDADWNELEDIRRMEVETILARAIGSGVPAGSDGFRIREAGAANSLTIESGVLFLDGWIAYNRAPASYASQPFAAGPGLDPALPPIQSAAAAQRELVFLDAWEFEVDAQRDPRIVDLRIGVETCVRLERAWVVRTAILAGAVDPRDPAAIPNRRPRHRYYPLALLRRTAGPNITDAMIDDLRRTHLTLDAATHAPLLVDDAARGQRLDSPRLADAFLGHLQTMRDLMIRAPEVFVYPANPVATALATMAFNDVRASATAFEQQGRNQLLHRTAALQAMRTFFAVEVALLDRIQALATAGTATGPNVAPFLTTYRRHLRGLAANDPQSLEFALGLDDLLGAVLAQERLNQDLGQQSNTLPEGAVTATMISVAPGGNVAANAAQLLTIRVTSALSSALGTEPIRLIASGGAGWGLAFAESTGPDLREVVVPVVNGAQRDVVLSITAALGASAAPLNLTARPERRQQLVFTHPPLPLAIGSPVLAGGGPIVTLAYVGPALGPGNIAQIPRAVILGGVQLPFQVTSLATTTETYQVSVVAQGLSTDWTPPALPPPVLAPLAPGAFRNIQVPFKTNLLAALSPVTWRVQLVRVTGGVNQPQANALFDITFNLT